MKSRSSRRRIPEEIKKRLKGLGYDEVFVKTLEVSDAVVRGCLRVSGNLFDQLLNPSEDPLPGDGH